MNTATQETQGGRLQVQVHSKLQSELRKYSETLSVYLKAKKRGGEGLVWDSNSVVESSPSKHETPGSLSRNRTNTQIQSRTSVLLFAVIFTTCVFWKLRNKELR